MEQSPNRAVTTPAAATPFFLCQLAAFPDIAPYIGLFSSPVVRSPFPEAAGAYPLMVSIRVEPLTQGQTNRVLPSSVARTLSYFLGSFPTQTGLFSIFFKALATVSTSLLQGHELAQRNITCSLLRLDTCPPRIYDALPPEVLIHRASAVFFDDFFPAAHRPFQENRD